MQHIVHHDCFPRNYRFRDGYSGRMPETEAHEELATAPGGGPGDPVTMTGLILESATGLRRAIEPSLHCLCGPSAPWFEVLIRLARSPGGRLRMSDLAAQTSLTPSGLTRAVDRLVDLELLAREACARDRRGSYASLTERGREAMAAVLPRHETFLAELFAGVFSPEEEQQFVALLRRLRDHVHPGAARTPDVDGMPAVDD
jgi:MarR family 2-MHQ and catechol resistance regulon transcriptional repressor